MWAENNDCSIPGVFVQRFVPVECFAELARCVFGTLGGLSADEFLEPARPNLGVDHGTDRGRTARCRSPAAGRLRQNLIQTHCILLQQTIFCSVRST